MENVQLLKKDAKGNPAHFYENFDKLFMEYVSVTKVRDSVLKPFHALKKARELCKKPSSKYYQRDPEEIVTQWSLNGQLAAEYGTMIHAIVEKHILSNWTFEGDDELEQRVINQFKIVMKELHTELKPLGFEYHPNSLVAEVVHHAPIRSRQTYNGKYLTYKSIEAMTEQQLNDFLIDYQDKFTANELIGVKSTTDKINLIKKLVDFGLAGSLDIRYDSQKYFVVIDIKTDETLSTDSWNGRECFLYPANGLRACDINKYGIQTAIYGVLGNNMELKKQYLRSYLLHWNKIEQTFKIIKLGDYYNHARIVMGNYFKLL